MLLFRFSKFVDVALKGSLEGKLVVLKKAKGVTFYIVDLVLGWVVGKRDEPHLAALGASLEKEFAVCGEGTRVFVG